MRLFLKILITSLLAVNLSYGQENEASYAGAILSETAKWEMTEKEQELQKWLGNIQLAWPVLKMLQNAAVSKAITDSPQCWASPYIRAVASTSYLALFLRLHLLVEKLVGSLAVLDEMEKLIHESEDGALPQAKFFEINLKEYELAVNSAEKDFYSDIMDLISSSADLAVLIVETALAKAPLVCEPKILPERSGRKFPSLPMGR